MTLQQDSTDPTGISHDTPRGNSEVTRAKDRKARSAIQLKRDGFTWDQIAESLGYPTARAALVASELAAEKELNTTEGAAFMRRIAADRYDRLLRSVWPKATQPEHPEHLQAIDRVRGIMRDHQDLLGYATPKQTATDSPTAEQIATWVAGVVRVAQPELEEANIFEADVVSDTEET